MSTGKRLWTTQLLANDADEGGCGRGPERRINCPGYIQGPGDDVNATLLATLPNGKRALLASQESGRITALDPDNDGAILWTSQAGRSAVAQRRRTRGAARPTASSSTGRCRLAIRPARWPRFA